MRVFARAVVCLVVWLAGASIAFPQSAAEQRDAKRTGSISGHVTIEGRPAPGVAVVLLSEGKFGQTASAKATTDAEGRYRIEKVHAGRYWIRVDAPAFASGDPKKAADPTLNVTEGEEIEGIDLSLARGGVITGQVTEADGRAVIGVGVRLIPVGDTSFALLGSYGAPGAATDDRGMYRFFGLPAGQYKVCVGEARTGGLRPGLEDQPLPVNCYPGVGQESEARVVEVALGSVAAGVDIRVSRGLKAKTFSVSGRIIDAQSGRPLARTPFVYELEIEHGSHSSVARSDAMGQFKIEGLPRGKYTADARPDPETNLYGEPLAFELSNADLSGLELKAHRAGTISGVVIVEGSANPGLLAKVSEIGLSTGVYGAQVSADGSFRIAGLPPGKHRLSVGVKSGALVLVRTERDGREQPEGIEIGPGESVTGVRVVAGYSVGVIRGQVKVEGGALPEGTRLFVNARRIDDREATVRTSTGSAEPDARGRFEFQRLQPGTYDVSLLAWAPTTDQAKWMRPISVSKTVSVSNDADAEVTLVLDLSQKREDRQ